MGYNKGDVEALPSRIAEGNLRLDEDEKNHALVLAKLEDSSKKQDTFHVETIHIHKQTYDLQLQPSHLRGAIVQILMQYTKGFSR